MKFPAIFFTDITTSWNEIMKLVETLSVFTITTFATQLQEEDANRLTLLSHEIIHLYSKLKNQHYLRTFEKLQDKASKSKKKIAAKDLVNEPKKFTLTPKLHHITHYGQLVKQYGPLYVFSALRWERKHQYPKKVARMMRCFVNPSYTLSTRHQFLRAITERDSDFIQNDFFSTSNNFIGFTKLSSLKEELVPLKVSEYPFRLTKSAHVLRKRKSDLRNNMWLEVKKFYRHSSTKEIYCSGDVYRIPNGINIKHPLTFLKKLHRVSTNQCILINNLNHSNDFMLKTNELSGGKNIVSYWLLPWLL